MSKPETPCLPDCYVGAGGSILHAPRCTKNAPKAEAPPNPVSGCASCAGQAANPKPGQTACTYCETPFKAEAPPAPKRWCRCEDLFEVEGREYGHRLGCPSKPAPPAPKYAYTHRDPCHESYPCEDCGRVRTKAEGGTVWTVCDECWDKRTAAPAPVSEPPKWMAEARDMAFEELNRAFLAMKARNAAIEAEMAILRDAGELAKAFSGRDVERAEMVALKAENATLTERVQAAERDSSASMELYRSAVARRDDAEAKVATLTAERDKFEAESEQKGADLMACEGLLEEAQTEVERLRDLILDIADGQEDGIVEAMSIRAAREAGKA